MLNAAKTRLQMWLVMDGYSADRDSQRMAAFWIQTIQFRKFQRDVRFAQSNLSYATKMAEG